MGELIAFKRPESAARPVRRLPKSAEILFFMGVQRVVIYDVEPGAPGKDADKPSGKSRRKH